MICWSNNEVDIDNIWSSDLIMKLILITNELWSSDLMKLILIPNDPVI